MALSQDRVELLGSPSGAESGAATLAVSPRGLGLHERQDKRDGARESLQCSCHLTARHHMPSLHHLPLHRLRLATGRARGGGGAQWGRQKRRAWFSP